MQDFTDGEMSQKKNKYEILAPLKANEIFPLTLLRLFFHPKLFAQHYAYVHKHLVLISCCCKSKEPK